MLSQHIPIIIIPIICPITQVILFIKILIRFYINSFSGPTFNRYFIKKKHYYYVPRRYISTYRRPINYYPTQEIQQPQQDYLQPQQSYQQQLPPQEYQQQPQYYQQQQQSYQPQPQQQQPYNNQPYSNSPNKQLLPSVYTNIDEQPQQQESINSPQIDQQAFANQQSYLGNMAKSPQISSSIEQPSISDSQYQPSTNDQIQSNNEQTNTPQEANYKTPFVKSPKYSTQEEYPMSNGNYQGGQPLPAPPPPPPPVINQETINPQEHSPNYQSNTNAQPPSILPAQQPNLKLIAPPAPPSNEEFNPPEDFKQFNVPPANEQEKSGYKRH